MEKCFSSRSDQLLISVITASRNSARTIGHTVHSVNNQTHPNVEHVFIDGDSSDSTVLQIEMGSRVRHNIFSEQDHGIYDALNKGLDRASGDVVGFLHADDFFANEGVLALIAQAFSDPRVQGVYGDLDYVEKEKDHRIVRHWRTDEFSHGRLLRGWMPPHPTLYVRKHWYEVVEGFDLRYRIAADYDSMLKFFTNEQFRSVYIPEVLVKMRTGGVSNRSLTNIIRKSWEDYQILRRNGLGGAVTLAGKNLRKLGQLRTR